MGFVLELQEPLLGLSVYIHGDKDAAGVVLFALLQVFQKALGFEVAGADGSQLHEAEVLLLPAQVLSHFGDERKRGVHIGLDEGIVHLDFLQGGGKGGVAAVVAPVGVQDAELGAGRLAALGPEILSYAGEVIGIHGEALFLAEGGVLAGGHAGEAGELLHGLYAGLLALQDYGEVLAAALDGVDEVGGDALDGFVAHAAVEDDEAGALDADVGAGFNQVNAVYGRRGALVKLAGQVLHSQIFAAFEWQGVGDKVGGLFSEYAVAAFLHKVFGEAKEVVHVDKAQRTQIQRQVFVEVFEQAGSFYPEGFPLLYKQSLGHKRKKVCPPARRRGGHYIILRY